MNQSVAAQQSVPPPEIIQELAHYRALAHQSLEPTLTAFPDELKALNHWVVSAFRPRQNKSGEWKVTKVPSQALKHCSTACAARLADNLSRFSKKAAYGFERKAVR